jgi:hypothetical protein
LFPGNDPEVPVTAYTAIYHQDGGHEVPAAVAGFKLPLHKLQQHLLTVTEGYAAPSVRMRISIFHNGKSGLKIFLLHKSFDNVQTYFILKFP